MLSLLIIVDYLLPKETIGSKVQGLEVDSTYHPKYSRSATYKIVVNDQLIRTDSDAYSALTVGDDMNVSRTLILNKIIAIQERVNPFRTFKVYVAPFTYFPLFPILFVLPVLFHFNNQETIFVMAGKIFSLVSAFASLLMVLF